MARIAGVDLPREKRVQVGLTYVYGIGQTTANKILEATGINPDTRVKDLTLDEEANCFYKVPFSFHRNQLLKIALEQKPSPLGGKVARSAG